LYNVLQVFITLELPIGIEWMPVSLKFVFIIYINILSVREGIRTFERLGNNLKLAESRCNYSYGLHLRGRLEDSIRMYIDIFEEGVRHNIKKAKLWGLIGQCQSFLLMEKYDQALQCLKKADELQEGIDASWLGGMYALSYYKQNEPAMADGFCKNFMDILSSGSSPYTMKMMESLSSCVKMNLCEIEEWKENIENPKSKRLLALMKRCKASLKHFKNFSTIFVVAKARHLAYEGWYLWLSDERREAHSKWRETIRYAKDMGLEYERGLAHQLMAKYPLPSFTRREIRDHVTEANEIWRNCGIKANSFSNLYKIAEQTN
jgi:tetratricopeptide (TPR) repeat protein